MDLTLIYKGMIVGFTIAAPVGPIGILCIRRTISNGRIAGLVSGLGAATADACYGFVAAFGITLISSILISQKLWLYLAGGLILIIMGVRILLSTPPDQSINLGKPGLLSAYLSIFFLTLMNPMTILMFLGVFSGIGAAVDGSYLAAGTLVLSVFWGSVMWWIVLSSTVDIFRTRFSRNWMTWVNRISGWLIIIFGFIQISRLWA